MGDEQGLRMRLEALNRGALPPSVRESTDVATHASRDAARRSADDRATSAEAWRAGAVRPIPGLVRRGEMAATEAGECLRIALAIEELWPGGEELVRRRCAALAAKPRSDERGRDEAADTPWWTGLPDAMALVDLETCGLAGSAVFLAGVLRVIEGRLTVELLLARDYSEESAVLAALWQRLAGVGTLVTFNGKSFDYPMAVDRSRRHRLQVTLKPSPTRSGKGEGRSGYRALPHPGPLPEGEGGTLRHVDLLHLARRRWKRELPDCKLQTLERHVCGRVRTDDMPSNLIPAAYQQFVKTKFEREIDAILLHNAIDLVTMLDLAMRLAG